MTEKRIRLLTAILLGNNHLPNQPNDVVDVPEGEGNALISVGMAEDAKGAKLTAARPQYAVGGNTPPISGQDEPLSNAEKQLAKTEGDTVANAKHKGK